MGIKLSKIKYLNKKYKNIAGEIFTIIEYNNSHDIIIQFDDGTKIIKQSLSNILYGKIKNTNPNKLSNSLIATIYNIGFLGIGKFNTNSKDGKYYKKWYLMFSRCYSQITQLKQPTYIGCSVDPIWHNFQNFCEWCEDPINGYNENFDLEKRYSF